MDKIEKISTLEELVLLVNKIRMEHRELRTEIEKMFQAAPIIETEYLPLPVIYINLSEAARLLGISSGTAVDYHKYGMLPMHQNTKTPTNKYLLSDILWIKEQQPKSVNAPRWKEIIRKRKKELGY